MNIIPDEHNRKLETHRVATACIYKDQCRTETRPLQEKGLDGLKVDARLGPRNVQTLGVDWKGNKNER